MFRLLPFILLVVLLVALRNKVYNGNVYINGYSVHVSHTDNVTGVIKVLRNLRERSERLVQLLVEEHPNNVGVQRLLNNWNGQIHELEHSYINKGVFGYNVNKGDSIHVCVHSTNKPNNANETFFVVMHEMAHIMTEKYNHDQDFVDSFRLLISVAAKHGLYTNIDYGKTPRAFCNGHIQENPTFSKKK